MEQQLIVYAEEIKVLFRAIEKNFKSYMYERINEYGFTVPQMLLLHELYHHPGITLKDLSQRLGLAKSTVSGIVDRLEIQGVVNRIRDTENRRNVKISLAPEAFKIKDSLNIIKNNYLAGLLQNVDKEEVEKIIYGLKKLNSLMEEKAE